MAAATIEEYFAGVPDDKRTALERLRAQVRAEVPDAIEVMSYGLPTFTLDGRWFVALGATKRYCSFYTGRAPILALAEELKGYRIAKGTINFRPDDPLPEVLVTKLLDVRVAEYKAAG